MVAIVSVSLVAMKIVVLVESGVQLKFFQWMAFTFGWFGMRPVLFQELGSSSQPYVEFIIKGVTRIVVGLVFLYISLLVDLELSKYFIPQLFLLVGLSLVLHFGILNLSAALWRWAGVPVNELFRSPYKSRSLKEFWGKRWNVAFSEMTALVVYRPLRNKIGAGRAVIVAFLFSGLLHEIAISLPVHSGYGLPMLYFFIHAVAMQLEATSPFVRKIISHKVLSHVWVMGLLILPMPLLFHHGFIERVLMPLRGVLISWM